MKKKLFSVITVLILCLSAVMHVSALDLIPDSGAVPHERLKERLVDGADILTEDEAAYLLEKLDELSERQKCDVAVVTTDSLEGMHAQDFADDYYDYNGFGIGTDKDGIVLIVSMSEREWAFSTHGFGVDAFTDATLDYLEDKIIPYLSDGDYYEAFLTYADAADAAIRHARNLETAESAEAGETPYYGDNQRKWTDKMFQILGLVPVSIVVGMVIAHFQKKRALKQYSGLIDNSRAMTKHYVSNMNLTRDHVNLVGHGVQRIHSPRKKTSGGGGGGNQSRVGGSSIHRSSSGSTHGGRSGKF